MRNFAAFIGVVIGGNIGWLFGTVVDGFSAWINQASPDHTYSYVMTFVMASVFGFALRQVVGDLQARHAAAEAKVERVETKTLRTRTSAGRTPPSSFPAFQA
jgi:hypothetical protein